jgi:very-short-patch-repair endonuclease
MDALRYSDLRAHGWSPGKVQHAIRSRVVHRVARGALLSGVGEPTLVDRLKALFLVLPPSAVVGFHTAAELYGFGVLRSRQPHIVVPMGTPVPDLRGVATHQTVLPIGAPTEVAGLPCAPPERCAIDLARTSRRLDAIAVLDAALRSDHCTPESLASELLRHDGLRGVRQARELVPLADPRAECRQESQLRLVLLDGRLPAPQLQIWVDDGWGQPRYRIDLGYEKLKVGGEYDGSSHLDRDRMRNDRQRHNWLASRGWIMRYFTDVDLYRRPLYIVSTMREAIARAADSPLI